ncbi:MAG TPA: BON domain-containing protein [Acidimicrobiales bacterium]|nr:BON domain-containing protein [Acidimicrobiales bacterium]
MIWLLWKLLTLPIRLVLGTTKLTWRTIRFIGISRIAAFGAGVGVGIAVAPKPADQLRDGGAAAQEAKAASSGDVAAAVRHELASSPRTWHLPQPGVTVQGDRVTLAGVVPHDEARQQLLRTAGAVAGVRAVDDQLTVEPPAEGGQP